MNFVKNETLKMWILWKMIFWKCEFWEKWDFVIVNFVKNEVLKMWILKKVRFSKHEILDKLMIFAPVWYPYFLVKVIIIFIFISELELFFVTFQGWKIWLITSALKPWKEMKKWKSKKTLKASWLNRSSTEWFWTLRTGYQVASQYLQRTL